MPKKIGVELIENFLVVWNPVEGSLLYRRGFFGKPLGIAKPKVPEFDVPLVLESMVNWRHLRGLASHYSWH
jgi:tRNA-intron endonuclease